MYHGTRGNDFFTFDPNRIGENYGGYNAAGGGFDFTDTEDFARLWGAKAHGGAPVRIMPVFLNAKKTFYSYYGAVAPELATLLPDSMTANEKTKATARGVAFHKALDDHGIDFVKAIQKFGYDSYAMYPNAESAAVFSPNQIKSATDNTGVFSGRDDVRYSISGLYTGSAADYAERVPVLVSTTLGS